MKPLRVLLISLSLFLVHTSAIADVNVLIVGSESDSTDLYFIDGTSEAFSPAGIKTELETILGSADPGTVNVTSVDRYQYNSYYGTYALNLASWFHWPYASPLQNLRGESGTDWDYVVLIGDPYTIEKQPGMYAYGVGKVAEEVAKGGGETILLMPWPAATSGSTLAHYKDVVYRTGRSGGIKVAPAALARDDAITAGETLNGSDENYIAAASIYSRIYDNNAKNLSYNPKPSLADIVYNTVVTNNGAQQFTGSFNFQSPYKWHNRYSRNVHAGQAWGGTSTEAGYLGEVLESFLRAKVLEAEYTEGDRFFVGRETGTVGGNKDYRNRGYGIRMFAYRYQFGGNDSNQHIGSILKDDFRLADQMIPESNNFRILPYRLLWAQILSEMPTSATPSNGDGTPDNRPMPDGTHLNNYINAAAGAYMYTIFSGRCPVDPMPTNPTDVELINWKADMIGYQTAWKAASCQTRAPGFKVMPSNKDLLEIDAGTTEPMTIQFLLPPQSNVTVNISLVNNNQVTIDTNSLVFTPTNYATPQTITISNPGSSIAENAFEIRFSTTSDDVVYDGLYDSWTYDELGDFLTPENPDHTVPGVYWERVLGTSSYPNFDAVTPDAEGTHHMFRLSNEPSSVRFAKRYTGYLNVPQNGLYTFYTEGVEKARVLIGDTQVAEHTRYDAKGQGLINLRAGKHAITVLYAFADRRTKRLDVRWEGPGVSKQEIQSGSLSRVPPNTAPVSNAGIDQTLQDNDENGSEDVTLDGSGSIDPDGTIASYVWKNGDTIIETGVAPTVNLLVGVHTITLTVTDNHGLTHTDSVLITVEAPNTITNTITFDSAGGSAVASITQNSGTAITPPSNPTRTGYTFAGWSPSVPSTMPASNITCTAQWTPIPSGNTPPVAGFSRWFDASQITGVANGGSVTTWQDVSGNGANATVPSGNAAPVYVADAGTGTGLGALYFARNSGANNSAALRFASDSNIRTVFSVFKGSSFLLTSANSYHFHRPGNTNAADPLWISQYASPNIKNGSTYVNGALVNGTTTAMPTSENNGFNLVSVVTTGAVTADSFNKDRTYHAGNQYQAEVIIYDRVLTEAERLAVEDYLNAKWFGSTTTNTPPVADAGLDKTATLNEGVLWTPADIGSTAWYDASDASTLTLNGSAVSVWQDKSGNGNDATQGDSAKQPTTGATIGALNALSFDADILNTALTQLTDVSIYYVADATLKPGNANNCPLGASTGYNQGGCFITLQDYNNPGDANHATFYGGLLDSSIVFLNGVNAATDHGFSPAIFSHSGTGLSAESLAYKIGTSQANEGQSYLGTIGEIIICPSEHDEATRQKIEGYLAHKWGLTASLPADHPYKNSAPQDSGPSASVELTDATVADEDAGATLSQSWELVSKPAGAANPTFSSTTVLNPTVSFTATGTYELRLTASDGTATHSDNVTITVENPSSADPYLQAHLKFDETSGTTAADSSGKGNVGTLVNGPAWTSSGAVGGAVVFDGTNDYVTVPDAPELRLGKAQTLEARIKLDALQTDWVRVVGKGASGPRNYGMWIQPNTGRILYQIYSAGGNGNVTSSAALPLGQWAHVACVYDGATMKIYINGALDMQLAYTQTPYTSADPLTIGYGTFHTYHKGGIDEVKVRNKALTASEVLASYQGSAAPAALAAEAPPESEIALVAEADQPVVGFGAAPAPADELGNGEGDLAAGSEAFNEFLFTINALGISGDFVLQVTTAEGAFIFYFSEGEEFDYELISDDEINVTYTGPDDVTEVLTTLFDAEEVLDIEVMPL